MKAYQRIVIFVAFLLFPTAAILEGQELKKIKIGYPAISYNQIHIWVAKDAGLFKRYGLDAELIFFRGGQLATQALVAGDPPIVNIGTLVQPGLQGHDVVLIASSENTYYYSVVTKPAVAKVEQLKDKRLGVSGFGSASHNAALILLRRFNLEPNRDVAVVVAGATTERLAGMESGRIDATVLTPSEIPRARKLGFVDIYDMSEMGIEVQGNGFATSRSFIKSNRETIKAALKGYVEALHYIHHNKEETKRVSAKYMRSNDPDVLEATYTWFIRNVAKKPYPTLKGIQFLIDEIGGKLPQAKNARPEQFVDLSLLQELEKEGFFAEMGKRYP
ncbi:MAG: ABC transporter substrate-binding protein [Deltaproteobacteria bacterium]|jgi:NitT/TauT family transport system substrate-binding protein|nr:ABC transporter substrate-binding protein [Deltaproteobacteria bacterium]